MKEKRKYIRIPENLEMSYEIISNGKVAECITKDISEGGIRFVSQEFIHLGSHLRVKINFHKALFSFEALVREVWSTEVPYSGKYEIGVEFIDIPKDAVRYLQRYIKSLSETKD